MSQEQCDKSNDEIRLDGNDLRWILSPNDNHDWGRANDHTETDLACNNCRLLSAISVIMHYQEEPKRYYIVNNRWVEDAPKCFKN